MMLPAPKAFTRAITGSLVVSEGVADGTEAEGGPSGVSRRARRSEVEADDTDIEDGLDLESSRNVGDGFASILPGAGTFCEHENEHARPSTCRNVLERKSTKARMVACNWRAVLQSIVLDVLSITLFIARVSAHADAHTHPTSYVMSPCPPGKYACELSAQILTTLCFCLRDSCRRKQQCDKIVTSTRRGC